MLQGGEAAESALLLLGALLLMELCIALRAYVAAKQGQWADLVFRESMIDSIIPNFSAHSQLVNAPVRSP